MSSFPSKEQKSIIDFEGKNLLVSASAGSGKTATIIEKITQLVVSGQAHVNQILAVTFTEAAAEEMKSRLSVSLSKQAASTSHLVKELDLVPLADISTLHGFCSKLIRQNFFEINANPNFVVLNDNDVKFLKSSALQNIFQNYLDNSDEEFQALCEIFGGGRNDQNLKKNIVSTYEFLCSLENKEQFLQTTSTTCYDSNLNQNQGCMLLAKKINNLFLYYSKVFSKLKILSEQLGSKDLSGFFEGIINLLANFNKNSTFLQTINNLELFELPTLIGKLKTDEEANFKEEFMPIWKDFRTNVNEYKQTYVQSENEIIQNLNLACSHVKKFLEVVNAFEKEYSKLKANANGLDFNDLEKNALKLLENKQIQQALQKNYKKVFVDEYQDINSVQEKILLLISAGDNMVMVGDEKQSIYSFRNSDVEIISGKRKNFENNKTIGESISLNGNFRSNKEILPFINDIFSVCMTNNTAGIDYKKECQLLGGASFPKVNMLKAVNVCLIELDQQKAEPTIPNEVYSVFGDNFEQIEKITDIEREAKLVAQKISDLISAGVKIFDTTLQKERAITYSDFAVLFRNNEALKQFTLALAGYKIPVNAQIKEDLFNNNEIKFLLALLSVVNNDFDDISLTTCLTSKFVDLSYDDLSKIRLATSKSDYFYQAVLNYKQIKSDKIANKLNRFYATIFKVRQMLSYTSLYDLLCFFEKEFDILNYYLMLPNGKKSYDIITKYINSFMDGKFSQDLSSYLNFVANYADNVQSSSSIIQSENCVRILTIHASKGLEFPIVFLANCNQKFSIKGYSEVVLKEKHFGLGLSTYNLANHQVVSNMARLAIAEQIRSSEQAEEMRLLYVALTRAKNNLFIISHFDGDALNYVASENDVYSMRSYLQMISASFSSITLGAIKNSKAQFAQKDSAGNVINFEIYSQQQINKSKVILKACKLAPLNQKDKIDKINNYLNFSYPNKLSTEIALRNTVTNLAQEEEQYSSQNPQPQKLTVYEHNTKPDFDYALLGTCYHKVLEKLDFKTSTGAEVKKLIAVLSGEDEIASEYYQKIDVTKILNCIDCVNKFNYINLLKEQQFSMNVPYNKIVTSSSVADKILLQGVVDLIVFSKQGNFIVDYKTTYVKTPQELIDKYSTQLKLYKMAMEKALQISISNCFIYSFCLDKLVKIF